jgi:hypothetical protein
MAGRGNNPVGYIGANRTRVWSDGMTVRKMTGAAPKIFPCGGLIVRSTTSRTTGYHESERDTRRFELEAT